MFVVSLKNNKFQPLLRTLTEVLYSRNTLIVDKNNLMKRAAYSPKIIK